MLTALPEFCGFYESILDSYIDQEVDALIDNGADFDQIEVDRTAIAVKCCEYFAKETKLGLVFESLYSPREYNFETDRIFAAIEEREVKRIWEETSAQIMARVIKGRFTSRSGFISFYSSDLSEWPEKVTEWDHNQVETLLLAYFETIGEDLNYIWDSVFEDLASNGCLSNCITVKEST